MVNLSVVERGVGSFFLINKDSKDADLDAQYFLRWFYEQTKPYTDGKLFRIGSMTTDTCSTMRLFWQLAEKTSELAHVIFVPCDSHGLQLLIKDLCEMPFFKLTLSALRSSIGGSRFPQIQETIRHSTGISGRGIWGTEGLHSVSDNSLGNSISPRPICLEEQGRSEQMGIGQACEDGRGEDDDIRFPFLEQVGRPFAHFKAAPRAAEDVGTQQLNLG